MPGLIYQKYALANSALQRNIRTVLDVGCRDAALKRHLRGDICYTGIDLIPGPEVDHVGNVEQGLPFGSGEFDAVIALDLLEHTNDIWFVFDELLRVASHQVIVLLPNAYHWSCRIKYLLGNEVNKYILPPEQILDRHRWLVSYHTARQFCMTRAQKAGWRVSEQVLLGSRRTALIDWALTALSKNLGAWAVVYVLSKRQDRMQAAITCQTPDCTVIAGNPVSIPKAQNNPRSVDDLVAGMSEDMAFEYLLRHWIEGFLEDVAPQSTEILEQRVQAYMHQEQLYREKVAFLLSLLPERPQTGLDIGSSAGGLSVALAQYGIAMEGIEPSPAGAEVSGMRARRLGVGGVRFRQGVGENLPFPDGAFDLVVSLAVLEHVKDVPQVVKETFRVLKPGGYAYFEVPNNLFPFEAHYKMAWLPMMPKPLAKLYVRVRGAYPSFLDHLHYMNRRIVFRCFRQAGFINLKDVHAEYLSGKASGARWAERSGRLARLPWAAGLIRALCGSLPSAWLLNRAVYLLARKP